MLTGQVPFDSPVQAMGQRYTEPTNCVLSPQCRSLLDMMLTKQAAKRAKIIDIADHEWLRC